MAPQHCLELKRGDPAFELVYLPNSWFRSPLKGSMTVGEVLCFSASNPRRRMMAEDRLPMTLPMAWGIVLPSFWRGFWVPHQTLHPLSTVIWMCPLPEYGRRTISLKAHFGQWTVRWKRSHGALTFQGQRIQMVSVLPVKRCHPSTVEMFRELFSLFLSLSLPVNHLSQSCFVCLFCSVFFNTTLPCNRRECKPEPQGIWPSWVVFYTCRGLAETGTPEGKDHLKDTVRPRGGRSVCRPRW